MKTKTLGQDHDKAEILRRLDALRPDSSRRWGRMSVHQMVCHLADSSRLALGRLGGSYETRLFDRTILKFVALYLPLPWPPGIRTVPEVDQVRGGGTKPVDFEKDVAELKALTELVTAPTRKLEGRCHPIFGKMSDAEWLRWGYLHMDHHLRQFGV
jgi:hypothetical protein